MSVCRGEQHKLQRLLVWRNIAFYAVQVGFLAAASAQTVPSFSSEVVAVPQLLSQVASDFSSQKHIEAVQLDGTVKLFEGGDPSEGRISLEADAKGKASFQLETNQTGKRSEAQDSVRAGMTCTWSRSDGAEHHTRGASCQKPLVWFLPMLTLQQSQLEQADGSIAIQQEQSRKLADGSRELVLRFTNSSRPAQAERPSTVEVPTFRLVFGAESLQPSALKYVVRADNSLAKMAFEVRYSDYRKIGDLRVPFLIQRYLNGSLVMEIQISNVRVS